MQQALSPVTRRVLGSMLVNAPLDIELVPVPEVQPPAAEVQLDRELIALLRANLHAAAQHAALGHQEASFRECSRPSCIDAARLIPQLDEIDPGATDAELDAVLDRVLAGLEESLPEVPRGRARFARGGTSWSAPMAK